MKTETITEEPALVIRRLVLAPGEATVWHIDQCRRFTVIVAGDRLRIEYAESNDVDEVNILPGTTGWDDP